MDELPGGPKRVTRALPMMPGHVHCYPVPTVAETLSHLERRVREGRAECQEEHRDGAVVGVSYTAAQ